MKVLFSKANSKDNAKKNLTILFLGTFMPLLIVTIMSGAILSFICTSIIKNQVKSEAKAAVEKLKNEVMDFITPVIAGCEDFASFTKLSTDEKSINALVHAIGSNLPYATSAYYGTKISRKEKRGLYFDSSDWIPPDEWQMSDEVWYENALNGKGKVTFNDPFF